MIHMLVYDDTCGHVCMCAGMWRMQGRLCLVTTRVVAVAADVSRTSVPALQVTMGNAAEEKEEDR